MNTLYACIGLFALGALIGMYLLALILQSKETSKAVAVTHGLFVAIGLVLLIEYTIHNPPGAVASIILFVLAALGGAYLFYRDVTKKTIPKWLAVGHGLLAVAGFVVLLIFAFK